MRRLLAVAVVTLLASVTAADVIPSHSADEAMPRALAVAQSLQQAIGGSAGFGRARYLCFDWIVEREGKPALVRSHSWDRFTGRYRLDSVDNGARYSVYFNVGTRAGEAWVDGKKVADAAQAKRWLDDAYKAYINDSYWLLAPFKLLDPGVTISDEGEAKGPAGEACDVVKLSFAGVGLTPRDLYWMLIDKKSHLLVEWRYILGGGSGPPTAWAWSDWRTVGPIQLAALRTALGKPSSRIRFDKLAVSEKPDDAALTPPR